MSARDEIVNSVTANRILDRHIDECYDRSYIACAYFEVLGRMIDFLDECADDIAKQGAICDSTWGLPYWADEYNVDISPGMTYEEVRQIILNRKRKAAPANEYNLEKYVESVSGVRSHITPNVGPYKFRISFLRNKKNLQRFSYELACKAIKDSRPAFLCYDTDVTFESGLIIHCERSFLRFDLPLEAPGLSREGRLINARLLAMPRSKRGYMHYLPAGVYPVHTYPGRVLREEVGAVTEPEETLFRNRITGVYPDAAELAKVFSENMSLEAGGSGSGIESVFTESSPDKENVGGSLPTIETETAIYEIDNEVFNGDI